MIVEKSEYKNATQKEGDQLQFTKDNPNTDKGGVSSPVKQFGFNVN